MNSKTIMSNAFAFHFLGCLMVIAGGNAGATRERRYAYNAAQSNDFICWKYGHGMSSKFNFTQSAQLCTAATEESLIRDQLNCGHYTVCAPGQTGEIHQLVHCDCIDDQKFDIGSQQCRRPENVHDCHQSVGAQLSPASCDSSRATVHPTDCAKFFYCTPLPSGDSVMVEYACPAGQGFDSQNGFCRAGVCGTGGSGTGTLPQSQSQSIPMNGFQQSFPAQQQSPSMSSVMPSSSSQLPSTHTNHFEQPPSMSSFSNFAQPGATSSFSNFAQPASMSSFSNFAPPASTNSFSNFAQPSSSSSFSNVAQPASSSAMSPSSSSVSPSDFAAFANAFGYKSQNSLVKRDTTKDVVDEDISVLRAPILDADCRDQGLFSVPIPGFCQLYTICLLGPNENFSAYLSACPADYAFSQIFEGCIPSEFASRSCAMQHDYSSPIATSSRWQYISDNDGNGNVSEDDIVLSSYYDNEAYASA